MGLQTLAQFLGLKVCALSEPTGREMAPEAAVQIAATCESLEAFQRRPLGRAWLTKSLATKGSSLFLTGITPSTECLQTVEDLLPGVVESVTRVTSRGSEYQIARSPSSGMPQFAGLTFGPVDTAADAVLALRHGAADVTELAAIDGRSCYIKVERGGASYFLLACARVLDIDTPAHPGQHPLDHFLRLVPFLGYLRRSFGALCWHNEAPAACFIIDDPLLKERYGFLDFNSIESHLAQSRFAMNVAFIPWNCRRTDRRVAERFKRPDRRFSISIHGCDHTEAEFGNSDASWLRYQSRRALRRMEVHQELTGIEHNRVMVFPQGVFSKASLRALADEGFLAAVNSTIHPVDAGPEEIAFRDLLQVAVVRFGGVPLFSRRYPDKLERIALDVFLGRQVLIVEHHGFFKRGYEEVERVTNFINEIALGITWTDLEELCSSACLTQREPADGGVHVRAFGSVLHLRNRHPERMRFRVVNVGLSRDVESLTWNGRAIEFDVDQTGVRCEVFLDPGKEGTLSFHCATNGAAVEELPQTAKDRFKVFVRRHLSEVRDNYLDRSAVLSEIARLGKSVLPRM